MFTTQLSMQLVRRIILLCLTAPFIHSTSSISQVRKPTFEQNVLRGLSTASTIEPHHGPMQLVRAWNWPLTEPGGEGRSSLLDFTILELDIYFVNRSSQPAYKSIIGGPGPYWGTWPREWVGTSTPGPNHNQAFDFVAAVSVPQIMAVNLARAAGDKGPWHYILLCVPRNAVEQPHWIFVNFIGSITTVGAETEKVTRNWRPDGLCVP